MERVTERILRPAWSQYGSWLRRPDPVIVALLAVFAVGGVIGASTVSQRALLLLLVPAAAVAALVGVSASIRSSSVTLGEGRIEHRRWFVARTVLDLDAGVDGLLAPYAPPVSSRASMLLVLRGRSRGARIRLNGAFWRTEDLEAIARHGGVPVLDRASALRASDFERRQPGLLYFWERRWILTVIGGAALLTAICVAAAIAYVAVTDDEPAREVAASTVKEQDAVLADLADVLGGTWTSTEAELVRCGGDDPGWRRVATVSREPDAGQTSIDPATVAALQQVEQVMRDHGFADVTREGEGPRIVVESASSGAETAEQSVKVSLEDQFADVTARGGCERGAR